MASDEKTFKFQKWVLAIDESRQAIQQVDKKIILD